MPFEVFFPAPPYDVCPDGTPPTCYRSLTFRTDVVNYYGSNGWAVPPGTYQAHHIKTLQFGGGNSPDNGVLLLVADHQLYSDWWSGFSYAPW